MLQPPPRLTCIEFRKRLTQRSYTGPLYVTAVDEDDNEFDVVMKVRHPDVPLGRGHYEGTSLACELICAMLARAVGLRVPDYFIVEVRSELQYSAPNSEVKELLRKNIGSNFGTVFVEGADTWRARPLERRDALSGAVEGVLLFDSTVINGDRQQEKSNLLWNGDELFLIDHSTALPAHLWGSEDIAKSPLFPDESVKQHCAYASIAGHGREYKGLLDTWRNAILPADIEALKAVIPRSWELRDGDLDRIFRFLGGRETRFGDTSAHLRRILR